jgi:hypothetical protein
MDESLDAAVEDVRSLDFAMDESLDAASDTAEESTEVSSAAQPLVAFRIPILPIKLTHCTRSNIGTSLILRRAGVDLILCGIFSTPHTFQ